jgi:hypothetical protein
VPSKRKKGWVVPLTHVVEIKGGPKLTTLHDARAFILKLPKHKHSSQWDAAIRDLLQAAESGNRRLDQQRGRIEHVLTEAGAV